MIVQHTACHGRNMEYSSLKYAWHDNISESSMHNYMQVRYASSTNLSSGRRSCMCEYSSESAGSEGGVHHTAAGDIQGEKELLQLKLSSRTADRWRFTRKPYCAGSANVSHLTQARFCLK